MPLTLQNVPGFANVPDSALGAENPALAINLNRIALNASFGMVRPEVFTGLYKHGETVLLPVSAVDGYVYQRSELMYLWAVQSTLNPSTGWITGPDSLWYTGYIVDQSTGNVECVEYYRRSGSHDQAAQSNDGVLRVFTIGMRQKSALQLPNYVANNWLDVADSAFVTDAAFEEAMAQAMNRDAKFAVLNSEAIYMGEYTNGQTIAQPVSPADGYTYSYSQVTFQFSWRWTTAGASFTAPPKSLGQLGPQKASINASTGAVTTSVTFVGDDSTLSTQPYGRIVVVAFCSRNNLLGTFSSVANAFAEIDPDVFSPGVAQRASATLQLMKNIREAAVSCEFFTASSYHNGNTVPLPTSPVDGYAYSRSEITCLWEWDDTTNQTGTHLRVAGFWGDVSQTSGFVNLRIWRMPPGGPYVEDGDSFPTIKVTIVAQRGAQHSTITSDAANPASDSGSAVVDNNQPDNSPYAVPYYGGETRQPTANEQILKHYIPGDVASVTLPINLTGSYGGCVTAPTSSFAVTIKKGATTLGTINIAAGATTVTFSFLAAVTLAPGDMLNFIAPATPDATLAGLYFTISGTRT